MTDEKKEKTILKTKPETLNAYKKTSKYHLEKVIKDGHKLTTKGLADYMTGLANSGKMCKSSWFKVRCALVAVQTAGGFGEAAARLQGLKWPEKAVAKKRPKRAKSILEQDYKTLREKIASGEPDGITWSYLTLCHHLGCRPAEVRHISELNGQIYIPSAKKRADGRGLDRFVNLSSPAALLEVQKAISFLDDVPQDKRKGLHRLAQARLARCAAVLWPRRVCRPTLYTLRHQMGADLKSSGLPPEEVAAVMGHQSTDSVAVYGYKKAGHGSVGVKASADTIAKVRKVGPNSNEHFKAKGLPKLNQHASP